MLFVVTEDGREVVAGGDDGREADTQRTENEGATGLRGKSGGYKSDRGSS